MPLAVAAYNAGPESVARCGAIPPYLETQVFVNNVMGAYAGPTQMNNATPGAVKAAVPPPGKGAKLRPKDCQVRRPAGGNIPDPPRRPRAKIIEVRSAKSKSKDIAAQ